MNRGKVELKKFISEKTVEEYEYLIAHDNGSTTLELELVIQRQKNTGSPNWKSKINLSDIPAQETQRESAIKLAEWLERMAKTIRSGNYIEVSESSFKEIK